MARLADEISQFVSPVRRQGAIVKNVELKQQAIAYDRF